MLQEKNTFQIYMTWKILKKTENDPLNSFIIYVQVFLKLWEKIHHLKFTI